MAAFAGFAWFTHLPEPVRLNDTIATHPAAPPPDTHGDRDPGHGFFLHYASPDI